MQQVSKMADYHFTVVIAPDERGYHAYVPALPGCHTFADTIDGARKNSLEAIELHIQCIMEAGESIHQL